MKQIRVLALYRGELHTPRGTPIRVYNFLSRLERNPDIKLSVASWDKTAPEFSRNLYLDNNHTQDLRKLCAYVREHDIDVVIGYIASSLYYLAPLKVLTGVKIIYESQGFIENEARAYGDIGFLRYWFLKALFAFCYFLCDLIVTSEGPSISRALSRYNKKVVPLFGGVDLSVFTPEATSGGYIKKDKRIIIGYAGNARIWQGLDFLVETYRDLIKQETNFRLVLLLSEKKEFGPDIEVIGPLPHADVPKFLVDCDILVIPRPDIPSMRHAFSGKLPDYLAMGKAIISSRVGDADALIHPGVNGLLYTPGNRNEFIDLFLSLRDEALRVRLGKEALKTAQDLSWDKLSARLIHELKKIAYNQPIVLQKVI